MLKLEGYVIAALEAAIASHHAKGCPGMGGTCVCHVGKARFALSLYTHGGLYGPEPEEFRKAVGTKNWVLHRRTPRIIEKYGEDVLCLSPKQYVAAERVALRERMVSHGVAPFEAVPC